MLTKAMVEAAGLDYDKVLAFLRRNSVRSVPMSKTERAVPSTPAFRKPGPQGIPNGTIERRPWATPRETPIAKVARVGKQLKGYRKKANRSSKCSIVHPAITIGYVPSQSKRDNHY